MAIWFKLGIRSLLKNRRRSGFTIAAIAMGFAAINVLGGFMQYVFEGLEESYVYAFGNAHLSVFREGFQANGRRDPERYLIEGRQLDEILELCRQQPGVRLATPQLHLTGMLSNGEVSTIMFAQAVEPGAMEAIRHEASGLVGRLRLYTGEALAAGPESIGIGVAYGLAEQLGLQAGDGVIALANTKEGYMNALDATVVQLQDAPLEVLDEMLVTLPLSFARSLYGTDGADRVLVLLEDGSTLGRMRETIQRALADAGHRVEVATWQDLRVSYHRIRSMFEMLFVFIFSVVALIVALAVVNTISMAVIERTREIGTLRALGLRRRGVIILFAIESALLGISGILGGLLLYGMVRAVVGWSEPTWIPPNIPKRVPWEIAWAPEILALSSAAILILTVAAALLPARKASRLPIIDALGHV